MSAPNEKRQLLAIMVADIAGYSRMMAADENDTFARLKTLQQRIILPAVQRNSGEVVKWTGDGFIACFGSAVDAVRAAVEVQSAAHAGNLRSPPARAQRLRIGLNVGDVITVPGDVYGDAVNIAARLQSLAPEGGIAASQMVRDTVRGKFSVDFEDLGAVDVHNIPEPVRLFNIQFEPLAWTPDKPATSAPAVLDDALAGNSKRGARVVASAVALALLAGGAVYAWRQIRAPETPQKPRSVEIAKTPAQGQIARPPAGDGRQASADPAPPAPPPVNAGAEFRAALATRLAVVAPALTAEQRDTAVSGYASEATNKALAVSPSTGRIWRVVGRPTGQIAVTEALEGCEIATGTSCGVIATNDRFDAGGPNGLVSVRAMPRVAYSGRFDAEKVPTGDFRSAELAHRYPGISGPKALALHPTGYLQGHSGDATQAEAERAALAACNGARKGSDVPCQLYAAGDFVVLAQRISEAPGADSPAIRLDGVWRGRFQDGRNGLVIVIGGRVAHFALADIPQPITKSSLDASGGSFGDRRYGVRLTLEGDNDIGLELSAPDGGVSGSARRQ